MKKGNGLAVIKAKNKTSKISLAFSKFFSLTFAVGSMAFLFAIFFFAFPESPKQKLSSSLKVVTFAW